MSKLLAILIVILFSSISNVAIAGDDGKLKLNGNNNNGYKEVGDCFEKVNRGVFAFNQALDRVVFKPLAKGYRMFPQPVRSGTSNALSNLGNVVTIPNNVLQGQFKDAGINSARFVINSTLGIAGIFQNMRSRITAIIGTMISMATLIILVSLMVIGFSMGY